MIPHSYSETVAVAQVPAHQESACVTYCDLETNKRCKTGVTVQPVVCPTSFQDSVIVYLDSTRRRYVSRVDYAMRYKPTSFSDTAYFRPRAASRSFAAWVDHRADTHRTWYKSSVRLEPKVYSSTQDYNVVPTDDRKSELADRKSEFADRKSDASSSVGAMTDADMSMESLDYLSDGTSSLPEAPSPLLLSARSRSPLDNSPLSGLTITTCSYQQREENGNDAIFGCDDNVTSQNLVTSHRSGPFIYNVPKRRVPTGGATGVCNGDEEYHVTTNGHHQNEDHMISNGINGVNCHYRHLEEDLVDL